MPANSEPQRLVEKYVERDAEGRFLQNDAWADTAYLCPGHLPGPDMFTAIDGTTLSVLNRSDSVMRFLARSPRLGYMMQDRAGLVFRADPGVAVDTFVVVRTAFGWRIESPALPDRVSRIWILANPDRLHLHGPSIDSLRLATRPDT